MSEHGEPLKYFLEPGIRMSIEMASNTRGRPRKYWIYRLPSGNGYLAYRYETNGRFRSYYISTGVMTWSEEKAKVFETQEEAHQAIEDMNREYDRVIRLYSEDASRIPEGAKFGGTKA